MLFCHRDYSNHNLLEIENYVQLQFDVSVMHMIFKIIVLGFHVDGFGYTEN